MPLHNFFAIVVIAVAFGTALAQVANERDRDRHDFPPIERQQAWIAHGG